MPEDIEFEIVEKNNPLFNNQQDIQELNIKHKSAAEVVADKKLIIAATGHNCESFLSDIFKNIKLVSSLFKETKCILTESDSTDNTVKCMNSFKDVLPLEVYSLGNISDKFPFRCGRIAVGRNFYLNVIKEKYSDYDYLLVLDLDEVNTEPVSEKEILSNFEYMEWDMICANQGQKYYDLWSLRHPDWMPFDCWEMFRHRSKFINDEDAHNMYIRSRFIHIPEDMPLIQVQSAFGGAAFIKIKSIGSARHYPLTERKEETTDWPSFCFKLNNGNPMIFINPKFIIQRSLNIHVKNNSSTTQ